MCNLQDSHLPPNVFSYGSELQDDFTNKGQSKKFENLKTNLKKHLKKLGHTNALTVATAKANIEYKEESRNEADALKISRIA